MYTILEQQTNANGETSYPPIEKRANRNEAESVFYMKLASAAISSVSVHSVTLLSDSGKEILSKCYVHGVNEQKGEQ